MLVAVDEAGLAWLEAALRDAHGAPTLVLMHHPPIVTGIPYLDKYMCRQPERLAAVSSAGPARCWSPAPARRHKLH